MKIKETDILLYIEEEGEFNSKHTNKPLRWMEVSFQVSGEDAFEEIRNKSQITSISDNGEEFNWQVKELSHSYTQGQPVYEFVWELSEIETLTIETLILGSFEVKPYLYDEEINDGSLFITALVELTPDAFEKLKTIYFGDIYFPIIRQGINAEPKDMRFGKVIWSRDEESIKFKIFLVDKEYDNKNENTLGLFQPEMRNIKNMLATNIEGFNTLLKILKEKNLLTSDEIEQVKKVNDEDFNSRTLEFERVSDVDKYPLKD